MEHDLIDETPFTDVNEESERLMQVMKNSALKNIPKSKESVRRE